MIEIRELSKSFGELKVLENINLTINDGEIYGLVGKSGAGKSTLLRCINWLEEYSDGSIKVDGVEVKELDKEELRQYRKQVAMIFQHFPLMSRKNVYDNIAFPMKCWKYEKSEIDRRVCELAELVGITDKLSERSGNLSGGQKQRVAIARALTMNPKVLLCDEATSALDPVTTKSILKLLRDINDKLGITIILVAHQMSVVKQVCDRMSLLENGELVLTGKTDELFLDQPESLRRFLGSEMLDIRREGINIQIMLDESDESKSIISNMSREFDMEFMIINSEMSQYRDKYLGYLIVNFEKDADKVAKYLDDKNIIWRFYE